MKKNNYTGWQEVFRFSFVQSFKQKAYIGFLIIMSVILLCFVPVMTLIQSRGDAEVTSTAVTSLTVYDETGLGIDYSRALTDERCSGVTIVTSPADTYEEHTKALEESEDSTELLARIRYEEEGYFQLDFVKAVNADLSSDDVDLVAEDFEAFFEEARIKAIDVSQEQLSFINQPVETRVEFSDADGKLTQEPEKETISMEEYYILLGGIMVVMMLISFSGSTIATSIVTEKSTRVVEYMMIHIRPMALIVGKILAALALVLIQFGAMGVSFLLSCVLNAVLFGNGTGEAAQGSIGQSAAVILDSMPGINAGNVILSLLLVLAGLLLYSILAGLAGASVSKMEEMAEGMKTYQILLMLGSYPGLALAIANLSGAGNELFANICSIFPLSAPFCLPIYLLMGKASLILAVISLVVLIITTALLFSFTAKVYEAMIFYNGSVLKVKDILQIAKNRAREEKEEEQR